MQFIKKYLYVGCVKGFAQSILFISIGCFIYAGVTTASESESNILQTQETEKISDIDKAGDWKLCDLDGTAVEFGQFKGKVIFLNIWATWCMPCVYEMQSIQNLYDAFKNEDVVFIIASYEDKKIVKKFYKKNKYTFPVYITHPLLPEPFQSPLIPSTYIIDQKGVTVLKHMGTTDWNDQSCHEYIRGLLSNVDSTKIVKPSLGPEITDDQRLDMARSMIISRLEPFAEQNNLSPEVKTKLIDIRVEEQNKMTGLMSGGNSGSDRSYELNKIRSDSDDKIYQLLSEENYGAYQRYKRFEEQWVTVSQINKELKFHDMELTKDQQEQLVVAMYNDRQEMMFKQRQESQRRGMPVSQTREEMMKRSLEYQKTISGMYIDSAKNILTEPQLEIFKRYFDNQIYTIEKSLINRMQ